MLGDKTFRGGAADLLRPVEGTRGAHGHEDPGVEPEEFRMRREVALRALGEDRHPEGDPPEAPAASRPWISGEGAYAGTAAPRFPTADPYKAPAFSYKEAPSSSREAIRTSIRTIRPYKPAARPDPGEDFSYESAADSYKTVVDFRVAAADPYKDRPFSYELEPRLRLAEANSYKLAVISYEKSSPRGSEGSGLYGRTAKLYGRPAATPLGGRNPYENRRKLYGVVPWK